MDRKYQYRRDLPHFQKENHSQFITFTTHHRWVLPEIARDIVLDVCLRGNGKKFDLHGLVVMPDHVHLVLTPLWDERGTVSTAEITQAIKSTSAHAINKALNRRGAVWQDESFDHVLRTSESLSEKVGYIIENPTRAGLVTRVEDYRWLWSQFLV